MSRRLTGGQGERGPALDGGGRRRRGGGGEYRGVSSMMHKRQRGRMRENGTDRMWWGCVVERETCG